MKTPVPIKLYLQALGGKFLGPNAYAHAQIECSLETSRGAHAFSYQVVPGITNDGEIGTSFLTGSTSPAPILTMPASGTGNPATNYLTADITTVVGILAHSLPEANEYATLTARIPTPSGTPVVVQQSLLLCSDIVDYRVFMTVPGLLVQPDPGTGPDLSVYVQMMCGCKVTQGLPTSFWTPSDFVVSALVHYKHGKSASYPMAFNAQANNSSFCVTVPDRDKIARVTFFAQQKSTGNYGAYTQDF